LLPCRTTDTPGRGVLVSPFQIFPVIFMVCAAAGAARIRRMYNKVEALLIFTG
jgi:hypothetical protein